MAICSTCKREMDDLRPYSICEWCIGANVRAAEAFRKGYATAVVDTIAQISKLDPHEAWRKS